MTCKCEIKAELLATLKGIIANVEREGFEYAPFWDGVRATIAKAERKDSTPSPNKCHQ